MALRVTMCGSIQGPNCSDVSARSTFPRLSGCPTPRSYLIPRDDASPPRFAPSTMAYAGSLARLLPEVRQRRPAEPLPRALIDSGQHCRRSGIPRGRLRRRHPGGCAPASPLSSSSAAVMGNVQLPTTTAATRPATTTAKRPCDLLSPPVGLRRAHRVVASAAVAPARPKFIRRERKYPL